MEDVFPIENGYIPASYVSLPEGRWSTKVILFLLPTVGPINLFHRHAVTMLGGGLDFFIFTPILMVESCNLLFTSRTLLVWCVGSASPWNSAFFGPLAGGENFSSPVDFLGAKKTFAIKLPEITDVKWATVLLFCSFLICGFCFMLLFFVA